MWPYKLSERTSQTAQTQPYQVSLEQQLTLCIVFDETKTLVQEQH